jgi:hypothetical protein
VALGREDDQGGRPGQFCLEFYIMACRDVMQSFSGIFQKREIVVSFLGIGEHVVAFI